MITLKTLKDATEQEVFDQVANHLLTQGVKCQDHSYRCMYRHNGLKCAAGCLIGDDEYNLNMEQKLWNENFSPYHNSLIRSLQGIHDAFDTCYWISELKKCALHFKLETKVLEKYEPLA